MRPDLAPGSPEEWLRRARSNLLRAKQPKPDGVLWEDLCYDAQQAVEKSVKALLVLHGIRFRYVHDIAELLTTLEQDGQPLPEEIRASAALTEYAVAARYPRPTEAVTEVEYQEAVTLAELTVRWAEQQVEAIRKGSD